VSTALETYRRTAAHSPYIEWAKLKSQARFNLATSGVAGYPLAKLPVRIEDLEINPPGGRYGYGPLVERLARHAGVAEDCVVNSIGTSLANFMAYCGTLEPGDDILVERPIYGPMVEAAQFLGANIHSVERRFENGFALDPADVRKTITPRTKLISLTNLHNPSGAFMDDDTLRAIGQIAQSGGAYVMVDEVYLDMLFDPAVRSSFHLGGPFIVTSSLTKVYGLSGLRCGWILAPSEISRRIWRISDLMENVNAHPAELISVIALDHLAEIRALSKALLDANRALLNQFLDSRSDLQFVRPAAGTVVFPKLASGNTPEFVKFLREKFETSVVPGEFFGMPQHFRVGIGGETQVVKDGLERLAAALDAWAAR
jgi:aspartate/methionine/tyrosine aminotransferase